MLLLICLSKLLIVCSAKRTESIASGVKAALVLNTDKVEFNPPNTCSPNFP